MFLLKSLIFLFFLFTLGCSSSTEKKFNSPEQLQKPYVLLISIDGYRHDYTKLYRPPNILKFLAKGSKAKSLIPSFPTKTFPNHYTIVTGLYPNNHGIIANFFYAPDLKADYALNRRETVTDGRFYGGTPLWSLAEKQNMLAGTVFWPGSEAEISGVRPTYYLDYDHFLSHEKRIGYISEWLSKPEKERPHFLTLYFSDVDSAGHKYGPDSLDVREAVLNVDASLGRLFEKIQATGLPVNIIITSDHGMTGIHPSGKSFIETFFQNKEDRETLDKYKIVGKGPLVHLYYEGEEKDRKRDSYWLASHLNKKAKTFRAYTREDMPAELNFNSNIRNGDVIILAKMGHSVGTRSSLARLPEGNHGYRQTEGKDMHGIFYTAGPQIRSGKTLQSFENIHIYPFIADILGLKLLTPIDGKRRVLQSLLQ